MSSTRGGDPVGYLFSEQISILSSTKQDRRNKLRLVLEGVTIYGDRPRSKNRNRNDLGEKNIRKKICG